MKNYTIRSHRARKKAAKLLIKNGYFETERINRTGCEAIAEYLLLEDIESLLSRRLELVRNQPSKTRGGQMAQDRMITKYEKLLDLYTTWVEMASIQVYDHQFARIRRTIKERPLIRAASDPRNLDVLGNLSINSLKELSNEVSIAESEVASRDKRFEDLENHEKNVRSLKELPSEKDIEAVIKSVEDAIPVLKDDKKSEKPRKKNRRNFK